MEPKHAAARAVWVVNRGPWGKRLTVTVREGDASARAPDCTASGPTRDCPHLAPATGGLDTQSYCCGLCGHQVTISGFAQG
jgi:hypothetical protein